MVLCFARQRRCDFFFRRSARGGRCEASATSAASCSATRCRPHRRGSARLDLGQSRRAFPAGVSRRRPYRRGLRRGVLSAPPAPPALPWEEAAAAAAATATRRGCETSARSTRRSRRSTCSWGSAISVSLYDEFFFGVGRRSTCSWASTTPPSPASAACCTRRTRACPTFGAPSARGRRHGKKEANAAAARVSPV